MAKGRVIKWSLGILAVLVVICLGAVAYVLSTMDFNTFKPEIEKAVLDATGRKLTMAGDVKLKIGFSPALSVENVSFANAEWGSRPNLASIKRLDVQVAFFPLFSGDVQIKRLILLEPDILLETNKKGVSNVAFETGKQESKSARDKKTKPESEKSGAMPEIQVDKLVLKDAQITYKDGKTGASHQLALANVEAGLDKKEGLKFSVQGTYNDQPFQVEGDSGQIAQALNPNEPWPFQIEAQAGGATVSLEGSVKDLAGGTGLELLFSVFGKNLTDLNTLAGAELPDIGKYSLSGKIMDTGPKAFHISDLKGELGESDLSGAASLDINGKRPFVNLSLASKTLDLRPFLPNKSVPIEKGQPKAETEPKQKSERVLPDDPLPTDLFFLADCKADIRAETIQLQGYALTNLLVDLILKNGVLDVPTLKATGGEGTLDLALKAAALGKNMDLEGKATLDQLNLGGLLGFMGITEAFKGDLDLGLDFKGKGATVREIMAGLDGFLSLSVKDGKLLNKYLDLLGGDLTSGVMRMINPAAEKKDYTKVNCLIARLNVENGLTDTKVMVMDTEYMSIIGQGTIDFKTEKLNMSLDPMPKKGMLSGVNLSFSLSELAQPFALGGTLAAPKLVIDRTKAALTLGKGVGGALLFGPAGAAAALLGGSQTDENPCESAVAAAEKGVKYDGSGSKGSEQGVAEKAADSVVDGLKGVGKGFKDMFSQ
ncbi:MAG: AsmA family protein [Desulfatibacillum sp.]|nr:AsmA family protein [Desulfatibacillum sp.]